MPVAAQQAEQAATQAPAADHKAMHAEAEQATDSDEASSRTPAPPDARVYFISPHDGDTVTNPFVVRFGLAGMGVAPSGVDRPGTGHFHLLIDVDEPPDPDAVIPSDAQHRHFGGGQIQTTLSLPPGQHTLQLLMGDAHHIPTDPVVISRVISITVKAAKPEPAESPQPAEAQPAPAAEPE